MGTLSYKQKRSVINHLADPGNWARREIDMDWLADPARRFKVTGMNGTAITHIDSHHVIVSDPKINGFLEIRRKGDELETRDETGKTVVFHRTGKYFRDGEQLGLKFSFFNTWPDFQKLEGNRADLYEAGLSLLFEKDSGKKLFFHDSGGIAVFPPTPPELRQASPSPLRSLFQRHVVSFPPTFETTAGPGDAAKLVIAFDFAVEPDLKTLNRLAPTAGWLRDDDGELTLQSLQEPWNDSVEFAGHFMAVPHNFSISKTESGFDVSTSRDFRDWVVNHAQIVQAAAQNRTHPLPTNQKQLRFIDLASGLFVKVVDEQEWRYGTYQSSNAPELARNMRTILGQRLHLSGRDYVAVNYDTGRTVVAVNEEELNRTGKAVAATKNIVSAIEKGLPKGANALDFLRENFANGADPRYYYGERGERTFSELMVRHGRRELERALIELQGAHEFAVIQNKPKNELLM